MPCRTSVCGSGLPPPQNQLFPIDDDAMLVLIVLLVLRPLLRVGATGRRPISAGEGTNAATVDTSTSSRSAATGQPGMIFVSCGES